MLRAALVASMVAVIAGLALVLVTGTLIGALLIIGGVGGLGWALVPAVFDRIVGFLSTGSLRRPSAK